MTDLEAAGPFAEKAFAIEDFLEDGRKEWRWRSVFL